MRHSIVVPLYNKSSYIAEAIASLAAQGKSPDQIIIVDDASTDDGPEHARRALSEHARALRGTQVELVRLASNHGPGHARNIGLERATGDLIGFLDADDCYRPDALRRIADNMCDHDLDMVVLGYASDPEGERFPDIGALADESTAIAPDLFLLPEPLRTAGCPEFMMGRASNVVVRRAWLAGHRYDEASRLNEGIDFWYRVLKGIAAQPGARVGLIAAPLIRFRILDDSLSHRVCDDWRQLQVPPSIARHADSEDSDDRRLVTMLGQRWLDHAMSSLPGAEQRFAFIDHHLPLLTRIGIQTPSRQVERKA